MGERTAPRPSVKRIYDAPAAADGYRVLVDRMWPRGVSREGARLDEWSRDVAPSDELRRWFDHRPERWPGFCQRYEKELGDRAAAVRGLVERCAREKVTLLFASKDRDHNNAVALRNHIVKQSGGSR